MLPLSVFIWLLFESYNFVIHNWNYNIAPMQLWQRWLGYALSFATVLPGIFITSDLVETFWGRFDRPAASECEILPSRQFPKSSLPFAAVGSALTIVPLIWPKYFFAAVWLGPIFLFDPLLAKVRIKSLSPSILEGNRRRVWCLMLGGLLCGLMWEFWNFWAGSKWNYTVPFFGEWKVFEMPILGFLGFPPFAIECWILYHLLRQIPQQLNARVFRIAWYICLGALSIIIMRGIDQHTVIRFAEKAFQKIFNGSISPCVSAWF